MSSLSDLNVRLDSRRKVLPAVFSENMKLREETHHLGMTLMLLMSDSCHWNWLLTGTITCLSGRKALSNSSKQSVLIVTICNYETDPQYTDEGGA